VAEQGVVLEDEADLALADVPGAGVLALKKDSARAREVEAGDDAKERRFARAGRPQQRHQLARLDPKIDTGERLEAIEPLAQIGDLDAHPLTPLSAAWRRSPR
jgi:hypothetical protein